MDKIKVTLSKNLKKKPSENEALGFGKIFTDHMFIMNYDKGQGWHDPRIVPYGPLEMDPASMCLHYGQEVFEGLKAYLADDGRALLFRPEKNFERLNVSNERMCIPQVDEELCLEALKQLVKIEKDWIPTAEGSSLYIRPFIISVDPFLGVHPSNSYLFIIILAPSGTYYPQGINPTKIAVENKYVRAVRGGTGFAKTAANYAISLKAQAEAEELGYNQALWLDGVERKYVEEVGAMNIFFKIKGKVITPALQGSILSGVTRMSVIELLKSWGEDVEERAISVDEIIEASDAGELEEMFGTGTAAVVSPVGELLIGDKKIIINDNKTGELSQKLYDCLTGIQRGKTEGPEGWSVEV